MRPDSRMRARIIGYAIGMIAVWWSSTASLGDEPADQASPSSVLVQLTPLHQGTLPQTVTAYGSVQADAAARDTVMAPLAAHVGTIYVHLGEEVAQGRPLVSLVPNPQTTATYNQAVSALQVATQSVTRTRQLLVEHLATKQQLADEEKAESDARAALDALRAQGAEGTTVLRAPFHAIVIALSASTNAIVTEGTPLLDLAPPGHLVLLVGVVPDQAGAIKRGDAVRITPVGGSGVYSGKVLLRGSVVDPTDGLVPIQISLPSGSFFPGETAQAEITIGAVRGYVVPHQAVLVNDDGEPYVVQDINLAAKIVPVRVLGKHGDQEVVDGALDAAAPLVLAGNYQLHDGMKMRLSDPSTQGGR